MVDDGLRITSLTNSRTLTRREALGNASQLFFIGQGWGLAMVAVQVSGATLYTSLRASDPSSTRPWWPRELGLGGQQTWIIPYPGTRPASSVGRCGRDITEPQGKLGGFEGNQGRYTQLTDVTRSTTAINASRTGVIESTREKCGSKITVRHCLQPPSTEFVQ